MPDQLSDTSIRLFTEYAKEATAFVRHYEDVRFKFCQLSVTLAAALVGIERLGASPKQSSLTPWLIIFLGLCGTLVTLKYSERADRHAAIARQLRSTLSKMNTAGPDLELNYQEGARLHKEKVGIVQALRARYFWVLLQLGMIALGVVMLAHA